MGQSNIFKVTWHCGRPHGAKCAFCPSESLPRKENWYSSVQLHQTRRRTPLLTFLVLTHTHIYKLNNRSLRSLFFSLSIFISKQSNNGSKSFLPIQIFRQLDRCWNLRLHSGSLRSNFMAINLPDQFLQIPQIHH